MAQATTAVGIPAQAATLPATAPTATRMELDRQMFTHKLCVPALRVQKQRCNELMKLLRGHMLDRPKLRSIVPDGTAPNAPHRLLLLSDTLDPSKLPEVVLDAARAEACEITSYEVLIDYTHLNTDQVLKRVLPEGVEVPSSFETIGHIAHLNLRPEQLPYKHVIGQVIVDKNPHVRTVVNKVGSIDNEFRVFTMELLAGEDCTETEVVQHGLKFRLNFAQVYWNSRLETEHKRLVSQYFQRGQVVVDIMAGIGPFAIPAAAQGGCKVYANDLNPASARYMAVNVKLNRVGSLVHVFNMDGRAFVRLLCATPAKTHKTHELGQGGEQGRGQQQQQGEGAEAQQGSQQQQRELQDAEVQGEVPATGREGEHRAGPAPVTAAGEGSNANQGPGVACSSNGTAAAGTASQQGTTPHAGAGTEAGPSGSAGTSGVPPPVPLGFSVPPGGLLFHHAVMNLPASAVEFLDAFNGAFDPDTWTGRLPLVHVYTFKTAAMTEADVIARVEHYLGGPLEEPPAIHHVRDVAPNKIMLCVTFRVPQAVAFNGKQKAAEAGTAHEEEGAATKRQKV